MLRDRFRVKRHEGKTLEFKRDLSSPENILRTPAAFSNTAGGTVVIGVEDGTKRVRGVAVEIGTGPHDPKRAYAYAL